MMARDRIEPAGAPGPTVAAVEGTINSEIGVKRRWTFYGGQEQNQTADTGILSALTTDYLL